MAARGFVLLGKRRAWVAPLLLIPLIRFGPAYATALTAASSWRDTAMDRDSQAAGAVIRGMAKPGDTLFVWGYRPELYVYTGLPAATPFLDSQPLTGVPADRHLTGSEPVDAAGAARRRAGLLLFSPSLHRRRPHALQPPPGDGPLPGASELGRALPRGRPHGGDDHLPADSVTASLRYRYFRLC